MGCSALRGRVDLNLAKQQIVIAHDHLAQQRKQHGPAKRCGSSAEATSRT